MPPIRRIVSSEALNPFTRLSAVKENPRFKERVSDAGLFAALPHTRKVVTLSQSPTAGTEVPLGTVVSIKLALKDDLPMASLGAVQAVADKFINAGAVETAVAAAGTNAKALESIFVEKTDYAQLNEGDRAIFDTFIAQQGLATVDKARAFGDVQFAFTL